MQHCESACTEMHRVIISRIESSLFSVKSASLFTVLSCSPVALKHQSSLYTQCLEVGIAGRINTVLGKKGGRKADPIIWEGPLGPDSFPEPVFEFPPQHKSEFTNETPLRQYDNRREPWPKCRHGEDCLVQMCTDGMEFHWRSAFL